eukprot:Transcript_21242.p1 GENE.Transcript_21242~~Transcript_21242.p1  ORF type:complete len:491 (-),score=128.32 Transcript_21242:31-1377(-)
MVTASDLLDWSPAATLRCGASIKVGRHPKNEVDLPSLAVSKRHCTLTLDAEGHRCYLKDRGSTHGTYLNGRRLTASEVATLGPSDTVTLGLVCATLLRIAPVLSTTSAPISRTPPSLEDLTSWTVFVASPTPEQQRRQTPRPPPPQASSSRPSSSASSSSAAVMGSARPARRGARRAPDLFARLGDNLDLVRLVLEGCDLAALRSCRAVQRRLRSLSLEVQRGDAWRRTPANARALRVAMWVEGGYTVGGVAAHSAPVLAVQLGGRRQQNGGGGGGGGGGVSHGVGHEAHRGRISALAARGGLALSGGADGAVRVWRLEGVESALARGRALLGHAAAVLSVALSTSTDAAASCDADRTIKLWEMSRGECTASFQPGQSAPTCLAMCDGTLLSAGDGPLVQLWTADGRARPAARLAGHAASVGALAIEAGCIVSADAAGRVRVRRQPVG